MIFNQTSCNEDLRYLFCNAIISVFGGHTAFLDFLENDEYSAKYDCYLDGSGENYIINRENGEFINWYKLYHVGRCINISASHSPENMSKWFEDFLVEFKEGDGDK